MIVYFRVDAAPSIGIGHYMRCIALAQAIKRISRSEEVNICFVSRLVPEFLKQEIVNQKFLLQEITGEIGSSEDAHQLRSLAQEVKNSLVVLDGYLFDGHYRKNFSNRDFKLFLFDDFEGSEIHDADYVLNQTFGAGRSTSSHKDNNSSIKLFYGEKYILFRKEFWPFIDKRKVVSKELKKILITIGGSDVGGVSQLAYQAFLKMRLPLEICLITGATNSRAVDRDLDLERANGLSVRVLESSNQISELMNWSDLVICGGGSTTWELAFLGIPFLAVSANEPEKVNIQSLCALGLGTYIGIDSEAAEETISEQFDFWRNNYEARQKVALRGPQIIDGKGFERICNGLLE